MHADEEAERDRNEKAIDRALREMESGRETAGPGEETTAPDIGPDRARGLRTTGLSRMRMSWAPQDELIMATVRDTAERYLRERFAPAFEIMDAIWLRVRVPVLDEDGVTLMRDAYGSIMWERGVTGRPLEDWSLLGAKDREQLLYRTLSVIFELGQEAANEWGEAMMAKGAWELRFAEAWNDVQGKLTVEDKTSSGRRGSMEERYFAIYRSWLSRRADVIVDVIRLLNQRLKDTVD